MDTRGDINGKNNTFDHPGRLHQRPRTDTNYHYTPSPPPTQQRIFNDQTPTQQRIPLPNNYLYRSNHINSTPINRNI